MGTKYILLKKISCKLVLFRVHCNLGWEIPEKNDVNRLLLTLYIAINSKIFPQIYFKIEFIPPHTFFRGRGNGGCSQNYFFILSSYMWWFVLKFENRYILQFLLKEAVLFILNSHSLVSISSLFMIRITIEKFLFLYQRSFRLWDAYDSRLIIFLSFLPLYWQFYVWNVYVIKNHQVHRTE